MFSGIPSLPSDERAGGRGSPSVLRQSTQLMLKTYVRPTAPLRRPTLELKAWSPPRISRARIRTKSIDAMKALSGSGTLSTETRRVRSEWKGRPLLTVSKKPKSHRDVRLP